MSSWLALAELESQRIQKELIALFSERLTVDVPSEETNLFESGILDSQKIVELMVLIEEQFQTQIEIVDFEIENFCCVKRIADLILRRKSTPSN